MLKPLMNRDRASAVCAAKGVAALVLSEPLNIYHATGFWPQTLAMGHLGSSLAVVPADAAAPVALVTPQFIHYFMDVGAPGLVQLWLHTTPGEDGEAGPPIYFAPSGDGEVDLFERAARGATDTQLAERPPLASAAQALRGALGDVPVGATLATDGFIPQALLGDAFAFVAAEPLLRRVRMVKSPAEIALMRHAARNNAEAARLAVATVGVGDSYEDLRRAFFAEVGRRGGIPSFMSIDAAAYANRDGTIREGRCFSIDAVSGFARYHGDYGRTVIVGEPHPALRRAAEGAIAANEAVAARLGPGLRYSQVMAIGREAIAGKGFDMMTPSAPHSVGLFHTDEAFEGDSLTFAKADHLIEAGMVLSVDCPILQTDMGGTVHLEDMWLITADGCKPLNDISEPYIQI